MTSDNYKLMLRDDDMLYDLIEHEINKKYTFKKLCKDIEHDIKELNENGDMENDFQHNQCFYMCNDNIRSIKTCKNNSIDNITVKSRQIKKLKILKKIFVSDEDMSVVTLATTKINDIENKVIMKDFHDEYEMMYELFIASVMKNDPVLENHMCGYYGKKSDTFKLLLEYIPGRTLNDMTNLTMKDFSDIMSQLFLILNYAHTKYGFLHGDLHTENFFILYNDDMNNLFDIELPLSNGKFIKYKSHYKLVFLDFGLAHMKYKFNKDNKIYNVRMVPLDEDILGFDYSIPLVDITKLLVHIMVEIIYENKHKKISEVGIHITNLIQYLFSMIGKPNKNINTTFYRKTIDNYAYIYDLINANLDISFEELYIKFVRGTRMDIHDIQDYFSKEEYEKLEGKSLKDELEDTEIALKIIYKITNENIKLNEKIDNIVEFVNDLKQLDHKKGTKNKFSDDQMKYIYLNLFQYTCKYELNKNVFGDENDMISTVNKIYNKFRDNDIIHNDISDNDKYKVIDKLIEFKLNKYLDFYLDNTDIHNILNKYEGLNTLSNEQIDHIEYENMNKYLKKILIKNYNKLPHKIFQKNFIDTEINVKKFNTIEQLKYISNIVLQLKKQMVKLDIVTMKSNIKKGIKPEQLSHKSQVHHLQIFFYNLYKYCEKYSQDIVERSKEEYIDWISYNRIILYDYFIRHISLTNISHKFCKVYLLFLDLEDEIWEKFYKKDGFSDMANTITFSENMLQLLVNKNIYKLVNKLTTNDPINKPIVDDIKDNIKSLQLTNENISDIIKPFHKLYKDF